MLTEGWRKYLNEQDPRFRAPKKTAPGEMSPHIARRIDRAFNKGPGAVRKFLDSEAGKEPAVRQFLHRAEEEYDGSRADDLLDVSRLDAPVQQLVPTQQFIDLMQSVSFPLGSAKSLKQAVVSKTTGAPGAITISDQIIIDGHHRWSGVHAIAPDGTIPSTNIGFKGNASQRLAAAQLAIGAIDPNLNDPHPSKGGEPKANILGKSAEEIYELIKKNYGEWTDKGAPGPLLNDEMINQIVQGPEVEILKWAGVPDEKAKDAVFC